MQFLLVAVNAKYIHTNPAVYSLKAYAGKELEQYIQTAEYTINNQAEEVLADLFRRKPDVIGFSCYIWNFAMIKELLPEIAKILPNTDIWLGGPEVSFDAAKLLEQYQGLTGIMVGEGEETFKELLTSYLTSEKDSREHIAGLVLRSGTTTTRELLPMDKLPFLYPSDEDGILPETMKDLNNKIVYYESSRGCPFRCSYCLSAIDKTVRLRAIDKVKKELQLFLDAKIPQVKFIDRTFNCNHEHAIAIWQYIKKHDNGVTNFHFEIAADILQDEELKLLQTLRPGLVQLEIGVQTTNEETLRLINRPTKIEHIAAAVKTLQKNHNMHIHLDLIAGLPKEDYKSFQKSFNEVYAMKPEQLQLGFLKVLKGAPIQFQTSEYGIAYRENPPYEVLYTKWISFGELRKLKQVEEMLEIYYNSGQFTKTISILEHFFASPFELYEKLASYYEEKEYFLYSPARSSRYDILLEFTRRYAPKEEKLFSELLTYDYYVRENAKSRPSFAADLNPYRDEIWNFYKREEEIPVYLQNYSSYHARQTMKMTHLEVFHYPVWQEISEDTLPQKQDPIFMLFIYDKRDILTGNAYTTYFVPENHIL